MLHCINSLNTPFFLTGGTALSRYYLQHRYSDDLDLFVIADTRYSDHVDIVLENIIANEAVYKFILDRKSIRRGKYYSQLSVTDSHNAEVELKIDLINDVAGHYGNLETDPVLGKVDGWQNILANKLTALFRSEPKDVVDIWAIARKYHFEWQEIMAAAKIKEAGVEPETVYEILRSFPVKYIQAIKWINPPAETEFEKDIHRNADDILYGRANTIRN
ncbi:MAG: nucleotidyl transferase AbiEii/AbiGii toxin family protein [Candidatus Marinimicrobia bacterium]|nr:nucleotidyl transferase AbiEii/AbiGii toxin family protein [Candidatus Neomarinimicrobiota bacterium]